MRGAALGVGVVFAVARGRGLGILHAAAVSEQVRAGKACRISWARGTAVVIAARRTLYHHAMKNGRAKVVLLAAAAPAEAGAVLKAFGRQGKARAWERVRLDAGFDMVMTGIGKANAAGAVGRCADPGRHRLVLSVGIAGALPGPRPLPLGAVVAATPCVYADAGLQTPGGFIDCAGLGFPIAGAPFEGNRARVSVSVLEWLRSFVNRCGPVATVSTCSGTDERARVTAVWTGAVAEAMEGAAVATAAVRLGIAFGELRVISNTTGDRDRQVWDLQGALVNLTTVIGRLRGAPIGHGA